MSRLKCRAGPLLTYSTAQIKMLLIVQEGLLYPQLRVFPHILTLALANMFEKDHKCKCFNKIALPCDLVLLFIVLAINRTEAL